MPKTRTAEVHLGWLYDPNDDLKRELDSAEWWKWLKLPTTTHFAVVTPAGRLMIRRETLPYGQYWYAYAMVQGKRKKQYVGSTDRLTAARLAALYAEITSTLSPVTPLETPPHIRRVRLLGVPHFETESDPAPTLTPIQWFLLLLLILTPPPHLREQLSALLWPDALPSTGNRNLRNVLWDLRRRCFGAPWLKATASALEIDETLKSDLRQIHQTLSTPIPADHSYDLEPWMEAVMVYEGPLASGLQIDRLSELETWLIGEREHVHQQWLALVEKLARVYQSRGEWLSMDSLTRHAINLDPLSELLSRLGLEAASGREDRYLLVRRYEHLRTMMDRDLGLEPSPETDRLYLRLLSESEPAPTLQPQVDLPPLEGVMPMSPLIGRHETLSTIMALVRAGYRLITLVGAGGIGKTRIARELPLLFSHQDAPCVCMVMLADITDEHAVLPTIAQALNLSIAGSTNPSAAIGLHLNQQRCILILDNCEHLPAMSAVSMELLRYTPGLTIIATSRSTLGLNDEAIVPITPLGVPNVDVDDVDTLRESEAVQLLCARMPRLAHGQISAEMLRSLALVCTNLGGWPLAIELAAAWLDFSDSAPLLQRLYQDTNAPGNSVARPVRHRSLHTTLSWSINLLKPQEKSALALLAHWAGSWDRTGVETILAEILAIVPAEVALLHHNLHTKSLILPALNEASRFMILPVMRPLIQKLLPLSSLRQEKLKSALFRYYAAQAQRTEQEIRSTEAAVWIKHITAELPQYSAVITACLTDNRDAEAALIVCSLGEYWLVQHWWNVVEPWLSQLRERADRLEPGIQMMIFFWSAYSVNLGDRYINLTYLERSYELAIMIGDQGQQAKSMNQRGGFALNLRLYDEAKEYYTQARDLFHRLGNTQGEANLLNNLGLIAAMQRHYEDALANFRVSLRLLNDQKSLVGMGVVLKNMALTVYMQGHMTEANQYLDRAEAMFRDLGPYYNAQISVTKAMFWTATGKFVQAYEVLMPVLELCRRHRDQTNFLDGLDVGSWWLLRTGQPRDAAHILGCVSTMRHQLGHFLMSDHYPIPYTDVRAQLEVAFSPSGLATALDIGTLLSPDDAWNILRQAQYPHDNGDVYWTP